MDMHAAALPPIQPPVRDEDRSHPLFTKWQSYRSWCSMKLVQADDFRSWLGQVRRQEEDEGWVKHYRYPEFLKWMRYNQGGAKRAGNPGQFPENFKAWLDGARW